jgi:hypothetical protein
VNNVTPEQIQAANKVVVDADRALKQARERKAPWPEISKLKTELDAEIAKYNALQYAALQEFAQERGYKFARWGTVINAAARSSLADYGLPDSDNHAVMDHCQIAVDGRRPVAVLVHSYEPLERIERFAAERHVRMEVLPWSWWNPGNTTAVLFTPAAVDSTIVKELSDALAREHYRRQLFRDHWRAVWWPPGNRLPRVCCREGAAGHRALLRMVTGRKYPPYSPALWQEIVMRLPAVASQIDAGPKDTAASLHARYDHVDLTGDV